MGSVDQVDHLGVSVNVLRLTPSDVACILLGRCLPLNFDLNHF